MKLPVSVKTKLLILFILISAVPLVLVVIFNTAKMIADSQESMKEEGALRNRIVQEKISELYDKNLIILRVLAAAPTIKNVLLSSTEPNDEQLKSIEQLILNANAILKDNNNMILTNKHAQQLIRSDGLPPVNVLQREYFWEAMAGQETISGVITSLATGKFISVIIVPVFDENGKVIGLLQRDYNLSELQEFVHTLATEHTHVIILDKLNRIIAHSDRKMEKQEDRTDLSNYSFVVKALSGETGYTHAKFEGEESLIYYSRNTLTGWSVITIQPDKYINDKIYGRAIISCLFGLFMLTIIALSARTLADKISKPLINLNKAAIAMANENRNRNTSTINQVIGDELQQIAAVFDEIHTTNKNLRRESETDRLTQLYNKVTTENICKSKLQNSTQGSLSALYIIDLDHFKEANDVHGHNYGDLVLQDFAQRLQNVFDNNECIGRFGGDEFVVFADNVNNFDIITKKARRVLKEAKSITINKVHAGITASIGIAICPQDGMNYKTLFNSADKSLYRVKNSGRNGYCCSQSIVMR